MTTTYNHEEFYQALKEAILITVKKKNLFFEELASRPDIIQRKEALIDILTIFSFQESVVTHSGKDVSTIERNIKQAVTEFYNYTGNGEVVGVTPAERLFNELLDLAYTILPKFPREYFDLFMAGQGLSEEDTEMVESTPAQINVIAAILIVIKSELLFIEASLPVKPVGRRQRTLPDGVAGG